MLSRRAGVVALAVLLLAGGACTRKPAEPDMSRITAQPMVSMTVKVRGDVQLDFDQEVESHFIRVVSSDPAVRPLLSVRPVDPIKHGLSYFGVTVLAAPFHGSGRYQVKEGGPVTGDPAAGSSPPLSSSVTFIWWPSGNLDSDPVQFTHRPESCRIEVEDDGIRGKATCPKITNQDATRTISVELRWKAPEERDMPTTTEPTPEGTDPGSTSSSTP